MTQKRKPSTQPSVAASASFIPSSQVNWIGLWELYKKEVHRFLKVYNQTLFAPAVNALLLLAIFSLAVGNRIDDVHHGVPFTVFMGAGLIIMTMVQNAFANTSSMLTMGKVLGVIIDYLLPPLSAREITFALAMAGITRGIATGVLVGLAILFFVPLSLHSISALLFYSVASTMLLALAGIIAGIYSESFDHMSAITSYIITPLAFLSGTFYSIEHLPPFWQVVNHFNPFFYMIDGFRYSLTGYTDTSIPQSMLVLIGCNALLYAICYRLFAKGIRLKS